MLNDLLKKYDKYLGSNRNLDGSINIYRQSPFTTVKYGVLTLENEYLGGSKWVLKKIALMDSRRKDFIVSAINHNKNQRKQKQDNRASREVAEFILNSGMTIVT